MSQHPEHSQAQMLHLTRDAAARLLARSIDWGHRDISVARLAVAVKAGAPVTADQWEFCRRAVEASNDWRVKWLFDAIKSRV